MRSRGARVMSDEDRDNASPTPDENASLADVWVAHQRNEAEETAWVLEQVYETVSTNFEAAWDLLRALCDASDGDDSTLCDLGAGPLEDVVGAYGLEAVERLRDEVGRRPAFLKAAACLWSTNREINNSVDALLAAHGQQRM